jgi:hypothetical protein
VIIAVPKATPVTDPSADTVATLGFPETHVTGADTPASASTRVVRKKPPVIGMATAAGVTITLRTPSTVSVALEDTGPEVAEIIVEPRAIARTNPLLLIAATDGSDDVHATGRAITAPLAVTVAVSVDESPTTSGCAPFIRTASATGTATLVSLAQPMSNMTAVAESI